MAIVDLSCRDCGHKYQLVTRGVVKRREKRCEKCGSDNVRQSFGSYLRNGPLSSPSCGAPQRSGGYG